MSLRTRIKSMLEFIENINAPNCEILKTLLDDI